ncbi:MAG: ATP-binding cassette domain-containing protein [Aerococcus sp.]|nr:ATP-binding cassette domain-containing protein [Aerococcus sp.]
MIDLDHVSVEFAGSNGKKVVAVNDVTLHVKKGEIFGVVGYSGAGKSTLVRTINRLQKTTSGTVTVNGEDIQSLPDKELRAARKKIGMIFQHFNLMRSRTVAQNVAFPLKKSGLSKEEIDNKVDELIELVGLSERKNAYPSQLSGGQKQRVSIARALANDPNVLLCDEATSALDPKTTSQILELLKSVNERLGITIVIITHEMNVIKQICDRVAIMEKGRAIEEDTVLKIFAESKEPLTRDFIKSANPAEKGIDDILQSPDIYGLKDGQSVYRLEFMGNTSGKPLVAQLVESYHVYTSILFGNVEIIQNTPVGTLLVTLDGEPEAIAQALDYIRSKDIQLEEHTISTDVTEGGTR